MATTGREERGAREERGRRVLFVSDVHLSPAEPEVFLDFVRFLDEEAEGAKALYILGDLFDFWVGPRQNRLPGYSEIFRRTRALRDGGTEVFFVAGNRDFALDGTFATTWGLRPLPDVAEVHLGGLRALVTHGDLLLTRDVAYQRMRRVIRSRPARLLFSWLPLRVAIRLAGGFRRASGREIARKPGSALDPDLDVVRQWLSAGYDALIMGHVHRGERYRVRLPDRTADLFILGSWEDRPGYVVFDGEELRLVPYPPAGKADGPGARPG